VLIVEPDVETARRVAAALASSAEVGVVRSAREAVTAIQLRIPDLMVTELDLPDATGVQLIAYVHNAPATRHMLLLVLTRRTSVRDKIAAFQAGADDYLVKPVDPRQVVEHVHLLSRFQQTIGRE
jgi:DNA-binding response OmpR family regulator